MILEIGVFASMLPIGVVVAILTRGAPSGCSGIAWPLAAITLLLMVFVFDYPFFPQALLRAAIIPFVYATGYDIGFALWSRSIDNSSFGKSFAMGGMFSGIFWNAIAIAIIVALLVIFG